MADFSSLIASKVETKKLCNRRLARKGKASGPYRPDAESECRVEGELLFELLKRPCFESGMSQLLHVYLSSKTLSEGEKMSTSRRCQQLLWQVAASGGWSDEVLVFGDHVMQMAVDPHWNFFLQQVMTLCTAGQLEVFCARLSGRALELSKDGIGCRLLCRLCEQGKFLEAARQFLEELASDISEVILHKYGNFVAVKIMENFVNFPCMEEALLTCTRRCRLGF
jgi:hypothetical protein